MDDSAVSAESVLVRRDGTIVTVALNRPAKRRLAEVMDELGADTDVRCIVIRGAGDKAFAAGADISEFSNERGTPAQAHAFDQVVNRATTGIIDCPHPVIAMIKGACAGGGLELAAMC